MKTLKLTRVLCAMAFGIAIASIIPSNEITYEGAAQNSLPNVEMSWE